MTWNIAMIIILSLAFICAVGIGNAWVSHRRFMEYLENKSKTEW